MSSAAVCTKRDDQLVHSVQDPDSEPEHTVEAQQRGRGAHKNGLPHIKKKVHTAGKGGGKGKGPAQQGPSCLMKDLLSGC